MTEKRSSDTSAALARSAAREFSIEFPAECDDLDQDQEWFLFHDRGRPRKLRLHDYAELYKVPGLYEAVVYEHLRCDSPRRLAGVLASALEDWDQGPEALRALDLGAGNGMAAEHLRALGVDYTVGVDLLPEAAQAARRDRPDVYRDYLVADLTRLRPQERDRLRQHRLNCLVTVAALGFGDIPVDAFATAFNTIACPGWLAFTIKEDFLHDQENPFSRLVGRMIDGRIIQLQAFLRYRHRLSSAGQKLFYAVLVARKHGNIPDVLLNEAAGGEATDVPEVSVAARLMC